MNDSGGERDQRRRLGILSGRTASRCNPQDPYPWRSEIESLLVMMRPSPSAKRSADGDELTLTTGLGRRSTLWTRLLNRV